VSTANEKYHCAECEERYYVIMAGEALTANVIKAASTAMEEQPAECGAVHVILAGGRQRAERGGSSPCEHGGKSRRKERRGMVLR
jgi:hypothetical protein